VTDGALRTFFETLSAGPPLLNRNGRESAFVQLPFTHGSVGGRALTLTLSHRMGEGTGRAATDVPHYPEVSGPSEGIHSGKSLAFALERTLWQKLIFAQSQLSRDKPLDFRLAL
jgi:hypothetical protein